MIDYKLDPIKIKKKLRFSESLYNFILQVKSHQLAKKNPHLTQKEIKTLVQESFRNNSR